MEKRGYCNFKLAKTEKAIDDFSRAISLTENELQLYFFRGNAYLQAKKYDEAFSDLDFFLMKRPNHSSALNQRGLASMGKNEKEKACSDFKKSLNLGNKVAQINIDKYCK